MSFIGLLQLSEQNNISAENCDIAFRNAQEKYGGMDETLEFLNVFKTELEAFIK
jgi:hypothetical protein